MLCASLACRWMASIARPLEACGCNSLCCTCKHYQAPALDSLQNGTPLGLLFCRRARWTQGLVWDRRGGQLRPVRGLRQGCRLLQCVPGSHRPPVGWLCRPAPKLALQQGCPVDSAYAPRYRHSTECSWTGEPGWPVWSTCCGSCTPTPWCSSMTFFPEATTITLSGTTTSWCLPDLWVVLSLLLQCSARQPLVQDVPLMANQLLAAA